MIPVIDFSSYSLSNVSSPPSDEDLAPLVDEVYKAFSEVGAIYLKNHGFDLSLVDEYMKISKKFFSLPKDVKEKFSYDKEAGYMYHGYHHLQEHLSHDSTVADMKEAYDTYPQWKGEWPDEYVPGLKDQGLNIIKPCMELNNRILQTVALGLKWPRDTLTKLHSTDRPSLNAMRTLHYYPVPEGYKPKPGQSRCGKHTDTGSFTFIFQDNVGGLEIKNVSGEWIPATPLPGAILVIIGHATQCWTDDKLKATEHRVGVPDGDVNIAKGRQSVIFFGDPDNDAMIGSIEGTKYQASRHDEYTADFLYDIQK
ncbi:unnamed protein product [Owenia fusiformis]|uniref:Uncharacterized protein n=1 Tax=Owenia fusiformis TaxID=6347 RepID=A0A8J1Y7J4_OWEFU|nr:unnamed protein product [Owenia fusiformis]